MLGYDTGGFNFGGGNYRWAMCGWLGARG